jgi:putative two-component system response regulator
MSSGPAPAGPVDSRVAGRQGTVLVVDDLAGNVRLLERLLVVEGYVVLTASDGHEAIETVQATDPDLVIMDVRMPVIDGFSACRILKGDPRTRLTPVVLMTGSAERDDRVQAIESGADDFLMKPIDAMELKARVRSLVRLKRYTDELDSAESVILSLARTVEARDPRTEGHCERISRYAVALGRRLGLPDEDLEALHRGGFLHDIGKIAIPDAVLFKPGPLNDDELAVMRTHPTIGEQLCGSMRALVHVRPIIRHHHERLDGSGYPDGLAGQDVPLLAQIVGIVDVFDALVTSRPYREAVSVGDALRQLRHEVELGWRDRALVEVFATAIEADDLPIPPAIPSTLTRS